MSVVGHQLHSHDDYATLKVWSLDTFELLVTRRYAEKPAPSKDGLRRISYTRASVTYTCSVWSLCRYLFLGRLKSSKGPLQVHVLQDIPFPLFRVVNSFF
eukprot:GILI01091718.1.p1 GENE.GILI01091718.1~~GILI01091718.1.p1  ORF type:complete len:100 (-),score=1.85 GILI01091718.1:90-389(-)